MTNASTFLRSLIVYAICLPLAILLGYMLADPLTISTLGTLGVVIFILTLPILLRFHHPLLVITWNSTAIFSFLPGSPHMWLMLAMASLLISICRRTVDSQFRFISVPELTWPLILLTVVVVVTAKMTGGIGLRSMGADVYGGKRYVYLIGAIIGYFAMTAQRLNPRRARYVVGAFLLAGMTSFVGDFYYSSGPISRVLFFFFTANSTTIQGSFGGTRIIGLSILGSALVAFMLASWGVRGIFDMSRPWRCLLFLAVSGAGLLGGFRSYLITFLLLFSLQFYLEGMHRTRLFPTLLVGMLALGAVCIPFLEHFPPSIQRAFAFLPVSIDPEMRRDAEASSEWRLIMWRAVLPTVPQYLLLGKGYGMSVKDFDYAVDSHARAENPNAGEEMGAALAGDYHNGPLSVIIPFGIWGTIAFVWLVIGGFRVLYSNYRYGDPQWRIVNTFFLATYVVRIFMFLFVVGGFYGDLQTWLGLLGLSVVINGGVGRPAPKAVPARQGPAGAPRFSGVLPKPGPAFRARPS